MGPTNLDTGKAEQTRLLGLEIFVHLVSIIAVDVGLGRQWEGNTMVKFTKGGDAGIVLRFLTGKLRIVITRRTQRMLVQDVPGWMGSQE